MTKLSKHTFKYRCLLFLILVDGVTYQTVISYKFCAILKSGEIVRYNEFNLFVNQILCHQVNCAQTLNINSQGFNIRL